MSTRGYTNSGVLGTKFYMFVSNILSIIIAVLSVMYRNMCQFTCAEQTVFGDSDVCRALQKCGS
jgi:hypothetical protein